MILNDNELDELQKKLDYINSIEKDTIEYNRVVKEYNYLVGGRII